MTISHTCEASHRVWFWHMPGKQTTKTIFAISPSLLLRPWIRLVFLLRGQFLYCLTEKLYWLKLLYRHTFSLRCKVLGVVTYPRSLLSDTVASGYAY